MPDWIYHSQSFKRFLRRFGINGNLYELFTGLVPTVEVARSYQDDELDLYGVSTLTVTSVGARIPAVTIKAPPTLDTYVLQVDVLAFPFSGINNQCIDGQSVGIFTPANPYDPTANNQSQFFPGLLAVKGAVHPDGTFGVIAPQTRFIVGENSVFQGPPFAAATYTLDAYRDSTVFANQWLGVPGPGVDTTFTVNSTSFGTTVFAKSTRIWDSLRPPLRIPSGTQLALQLQQIPAARYAMQCTFLFREQNAEQL